MYERHVKNKSELTDLIKTFFGCCDYIASQWLHAFSYTSLCHKYLHRFIFKYNYCLINFLALSKSNSNSRLFSWLFTPPLLSLISHYLAPTITFLYKLTGQMLLLGEVGLCWMVCVYGFLSKQLGGEPVLHSPAQHTS